MKMCHAPFEIDIRRDPTRARLAPLLNDGSARKRGARSLALGARWLRRSRRIREG